MSKKWVITPPPSPEFFSEHPELPPIIARLLWNRNLKTQQQIDEFLNPDYGTDLHDPFLFKDMPKAVEIIFDCIQNNKKITVHGDYDADGVCASVVISSGLKKMGAQDVDIFLPHREIDGYGLNNNTVQYLKDNGTELIITCDCGISNTEEVKLAKELGMKVIITDHHAMPKVFPPADATIHPLVPGETYPDKTLAGGGVGYKLVQGLLKEHKKTNPLLPDGQTHEAFEKWLLDLVTISTVADMVPLVGESRTIARYGLTVLNKTRNLGLQKMLQVAGIADEDGKSKRGTYTAQTIGFQIAPRINAAGRMDHANIAVNLLMCEDPAEATRLAEQLNQNNSDRQQLTDRLFTESVQQIKETGQEKNAMLFTFGETWSPGVIGIVAGKIMNEYYRPTIVMGLNKGMIVGSGRSLKEFNLIAAMQSMPEFFHKYGGHPQACGFTLKDVSLLEEFKKALLAKATEATKSIDLNPQVTVDAEIDLEDITWELYDILQKFEPFGQMNPEPKYVAYGLTVVDIQPVGKDEKHLRLLVKHNSHVIKKTIGFGLGDPSRHPMKWKEVLQPGDKIDMVFSIGINEWNGNRELQLMIEDIRKNEI